MCGHQKYQGQICFQKKVLFVQNFEGAFRSRLRCCKIFYYYDYLVFSSARRMPNVDVNMKKKQHAKNSNTFSHDVKFSKQNLNRFSRTTPVV